jgi:hypothetical protein
MIQRPAAEIVGLHHTYANNPFENMTLMKSNPRIYLSASIPFIKPRHSPNVRVPLLKTVLPSNRKTNSLRQGSGRNEPEKVLKGSVPEGSE